MPKKLLASDWLSIGNVRARWIGGCTRLVCDACANTVIGWLTGATMLEMDVSTQLYSVSGIYMAEARPNSPLAGYQKNPAATTHPWTLWLGRCQGGLLPPGQQRRLPEGPTPLSIFPIYEYLPACTPSSNASNARTAPKGKDTPERRILLRPPQASLQLASAFTSIRQLGISVYVWYTFKFALNTVYVLG